MIAYNNFQFLKAKHDLKKILIQKKQQYELFPFKKNANDNFKMLAEC